MNNFTNFQEDNFWLKFDYDKKNKYLKIAASFPIFLTKENKEFVIQAPTFNLFAFGNSSQEAKENLFYQLDDFFMMIISRGEIQLTKWLKKLGWEYNHSNKKLDYFDFELDKKDDYQKLNWQITNINNNFIANNFK